MGLLTKLKSLLGFEEDRSEVRRGESGVTIEREPEESPQPDPEVESTVKGVDTDAEESLDTESDEGDETAESGVSTEDVTTGPDGTERVETGIEDGTEPVEAAESGTEAAEPEATTGDEPEPTPEETTGESVLGEGEPISEEDDGELGSEEGETAEERVGEGEPLEDVKGIGPAYAERLRDAGVSDVAELASADADRLAEETDLSAKRISTWIDRARTR